MEEKAWDAEAELDRRLDLVSRPEYEGEDMQRSDYAALFVVTLAVPIMMMVVGWYL